MSNDDVAPGGPSEVPGDTAPEVGQAVDPSNEAAPTSPPDPSAQWSAPEPTQQWPFDQAADARPTADPGQWPAPDHSTQVLNPDQPYAQTTTYPQYNQAPEPATQWPTPGPDGYLPPPPGAPPQPPAQPAKSGGAGKYVAIAAITGLLAGLGGGALGYELASDSGTNSSVSVNSPSSPEGLSPRADGSIAAIAEAVLPSVVSLEVTGSGQAGSGSGFVVSEDGYILTNNHVIEAAADSGTIEVVLKDGTRLPGELVGRNADYDLAVVKIDRAGLTPVVIGDSESVKVGDQAIAIGSPLGLEGTVTSGIVSALDRPVTAGGDSGGETSFISAIQTDAPINPGNSGGPLVNSEGQVIGVNSAIASLSAGSDGQAGSIGLGFAIPMNTANRISQELIRTGEASTPIIGAEIDFNFSGQGARVQAVTAGGPAQAAGLQDGDVIVAVNGERVDDAVALITDIRNNAPGDKITLTLESGKEIQVTLGQR